MRVPSIVVATGVVVLAAVSACGPKQARVDESAPPPDAVLWPLGEPVDTVTVALFDAVDIGHVSAPENDSERLLFHQLSDDAYRMEPDESLDDGVIVLTPAASDRPVLRFVDRRGADARDLLEASSGVDLLVLRDRATIDYAASLGRFQDVPLAPSRAYVLAAATRAYSIERGYVLATLPESTRSALALDAVRSAYAHAIPEAEWSQSLAQCDSMGGLGALTSVLTSRHILYDAGDATARDLADRIASIANDPASKDAVALAGALPGLRADVRAVSVGATRRDFAVSLTDSKDFAYIVAVPYGASERCHAIWNLVNSAPWLNGTEQVGVKVLPLVKTRAIAFARRRANGFGFDVRADDSGSLRVVGVGSRDR